MLAIRHRVSARACLFAGLTLGVAVVTAGTAYAANHDVQRAALHGSGAAKHDKALGPVASADTQVRSVN